MTLMDMPVILFFAGEHAFLDNFYPSPIMVDGVLCPTVENAFQGAKAKDPQVRHMIMTAPDPGHAKYMGRRCVLVPGWDEKRVDVMRALLQKKFAPGSVLAEQLLDTGDAVLIEGNTWGDLFWGQDSETWEGENWLGRLLMEQRRALREEGAVPSGPVAPCRFCGAEVDREENFCYGCRVVVCSTCDVAGVDMPLGPHPADAHRRTYEEDEE